MATSFTKFALMFLWLEREIEGCIMLFASIMVSWVTPGIGLHQHFENILWIEGFHLWLDPLNFIKDLDEDAESILIKFMDGIAELGFKISSQTVGMAKMDKIKFNKSRINVLHLGLKKSAVLV